MKGTSYTLVRVTQFPGAVELLQKSDCLVLPGVPGESGLQLADGRSAYPDSATDFVKLLREQGVQVEYAQEPSKRALAGRKSEDVWLPILLFARDAVANGVGSLLAAAIIAYVGRSRLKTTRLHGKVGRSKSDSSQEDWAEFDGPGEDVLEGVQVFLDGTRRMDPPTSI